MLLDTLLVKLSLVIVAQVASLTQTHGVVRLVSVFTLVGHLVSSMLPIARRTHVFGVVLSVNMGTRSNLHGFSTRSSYLILRLKSLNRFDFNTLFFIVLVYELLLHEVVQQLGVDSARDVSSTLSARSLVREHFR